MTFGELQDGDRYTTTEAGPCVWEKLARTEEDNALDPGQRARIVSGEWMNRHGVVVGKPGDTAFAFNTMIVSPVP